ncbi:MAG: ABC1 kinase family protein, partial [Coriobacteriales bacterium]
LGSASVAQVHKATLADGGDVVAVKVQRPGIAETIALDLVLMQRAINTLNVIDSTGTGQLSLQTLVDELKRSTEEELNFNIEAENLEKFRKNNNSRPHVYSPKCYEEYSCDCVLTMEYVDHERLGAPGVVDSLTESERERLANVMAQNYMQQIMEDGFFHADPHAGNITVVKERNGIGIEWLDFGIMGTVSANEQDSFKRFMLAMLQEDSYKLKRAMLEMVKTRGNVNHAELLSLCDVLITEYCNTDLDEFDTGALLSDMLERLTAINLEFKPNIMTLGRGLVTFEGTVRMVSGNVSVAKVVREYMTRTIDYEYLWSRTKKLVGAGLDSAEATIKIPSKTYETLDMLERGQIKANIEFSMEEKSGKAMSSSIEYFALAIIAGAMFIGSCVLCLSGLQPRVLGVPLLGMIGFICGLVIALLVFYRMRRDRKK